MDSDNNGHSPASVGCEIRRDDLTRTLYATDASIYRIMPRAVAFPKTAAEAAEAIRQATNAGVAIISRGAGSGLAGGAIGDGLVVDFARYNRQITEFSRDARTVRVGAGVVLDQLNAFLRPHGLCFGPDVATSSRATLGGMIANNSSGARVPVYGTTADHVRSLELVMADGRVVHVGRDHPGLDDLRLRVDAILGRVEDSVRTRFHEGIIKRWPGYGIDRYLRRPGDLTQVLGGSEGTLAGIFSAELNLVPLPSERGTGILFFASVEEAMEATVDLLDLRAAAIEHIDDVLFDQTRGKLQFQFARDLMRLDAEPCKAILLVEFYDNVADKLRALEAKGLGLRCHLCKNDAEQNAVWNLRKSGLTLLTGCPGDAKPTAGIEDVAVPPAKLPEYVRGLRSLMEPLGLVASYYGHAAAGLLHVRPVVDLHDPSDIAKYRKLAEGVSALTREFRGSLAAEHGVGIARSEFMNDHIGPELLDAMREIKTLFDPKGHMNPGKIFPNGQYRIDTHLRLGEGSTLTDLPFTPVLAFAAKDHSFVGNLEQCNGCGGCRKDTPTMCPTYRATGEDLMATRGRANIIRAVLDGRLGIREALLESPELDQALSNCLACKACTTECPSNVNMTLLKAELLYARWRRHGTPLYARVVSRVDLLGALASMAPKLANASFEWKWLRALLERHLGISRRRPLPPYAEERFDHWFRRRARRRARGGNPPHPTPLPRGEGAKPPHPNPLPKGEGIPGGEGAGRRGKVLLWDDCFVRHNEPEIGIAAVRVLEAAGYEVALLENHACCGRPAFSMGCLDVAARFGRKNAALLAGSDTPILFLEPSCYSMFKEDYRELKVPGADDLAARSYLFEHFIEDLLAAEPDALPFRPAQHGTAIHAHCHTKALSDPTRLSKLAARIPGNTVELLNTGCCGMAGAFGSMEKKYDLSVAIGKELADLVEALAPGTRLVASGTSCRHQIEHLTDVEPLHMAELLARSLDDR